MIHKYIRNIWIAFIGVMLSIPTGLYIVSANLFNLFGDIPSLEIIENPHIDIASELYSADGILLGKYYRYNRKYLDFCDISPLVIDTLLVIEDKDFYNHSGISLGGIIRAGLFSVLLHQKRGGGSTITQQLTKNLFQTRTDKYKGRLGNVPYVGIFIDKIKEWITAIKIERLYSKEEILSMYLNTVFFGNNSYGISVAAETYFNCDQKDLTYDQAALLISLIKGPTYYNPCRHPDRTKRRRDYILHKLLKANKISPDEYKMYENIPIITELPTKESIAYHFKKYVLEELNIWAKKQGYDIYSDGLKIYTTLDSRMQKHAESAINTKMAFLQQRFDQYTKDLKPWIDEEDNEIPNFIESRIKFTDIYRELLKEYGPDKVDEYLNKPRHRKLFSWNGDFYADITPYDEVKYYKHFLHSGLLAINPHNGYIKVWVGDINYNYFKYDNVKQSKRQPGSLFKGIVYATAIDNGMLPTDTVIDVPVVFDLGNGGMWIAKNFNNLYSGNKVTLRQGLSRSINTISAYLIKRFTPQLVVDYAHRLGIKSQLEAVPALCLGCCEVSLYELTSVYSTFMNKGLYTEPIAITRIEDKYGQILAEFIPQQQEAISEDTANKMMYMLMGSTEEQGGTLNRLSDEIKTDNQIAGKTGTTSNKSDGWCVGMINNLCTCIWVGGEERAIHFPKTTNYGYGANTARPIFEDFVLRLYNDSKLPYTKGPIE